MDFKLQLEAAVFGDLPEVMKAETARASAAVSAGVEKTSAELLAALRDQVLTAFSSQRLANSWRRKFYPNSGLDAASVVYSNAPHIIEAFSQATTITSPNGFWLAIPTPEVLQMRFEGNKRATPALVEQRLGIKLRFVYRAGKSSLLVADDVRAHTGKRKGYAKGSASAIAKGTLPNTIMFFLVPQVHLTQRLDPQGAYDEALDNLVRNVLAEWGDDDDA